jgi:hypothetical protein
LPAKAAGAAGPCISPEVRGAGAAGRRRAARHLNGGEGGGQYQAAARQPLLQPRPAAFQAPLDRPGRPAELAGRLFLGAAFQVTQDDRQPVDLRQALHLLVHDVDQFAGRNPGQRIGPRVYRVRDRRRTGEGAPCPGGSGLERHAAGDAMQPGRQRLAGAHRGGLAGQDKKRRLESVLGILDVAQHAPAHLEHQLGVPMHQGRERPVVPTGEEAP